MEYIDTQEYTDEEFKELEYHTIQIRHYQRKIEQHQEAILEIENGRLEE